MKIKFVKHNRRTFLIRFSFPLRIGSFKVHLILDDDQGGEHTHPWDFKSFLFLGAYKEHINGRIIKHLPFEIVRRNCKESHTVELYKILGFKLPCVTMGYYSEKKEPWCKRKMCENCESLGYCMDKKYWETRKNK